LKKIVLSALAAVCMSRFVVAGGDLKEVEPAVTPVVPMVEEDRSGLYTGLALSAVSTRDASVSMDFFNVKSGQDRLGNISVLAGYNFNNYIAVEGRYTTTLTEEDAVEMDGWSLFVKPQYPVNEDFSVYALLGYGGVTLDHVSGYASPAITDVDDTGFQWGFGMSYAITENFDIFLDYTSLATDMDGVYWNGALQTDVDAITLGVIYNF